MLLHPALLRWLALGSWLLATYLPTLAQDRQSPRIVPNGTVYSILHQGDTTYYGGQFTQAGYHSAFLGKVSLSDAIPQQNFPMCNSTIEAVLADGNGGWYVGGAFTQMAGQSRNYLVHILADGSLDPQFNPAPNGPVYALDKLDGRLYVGGSFTQIGGQAQGYLAALDMAQNGTLVNSWTPTLNGLVYAITVNPTYGRAFAGGNFTEVNGEPQRYFAEIRLDNGEVLPTSSVNSTVQDILVQDSSVYLAGNFSQAGYYSPYGSLLAVDDDYPDRVFPQFNGAVNALISDGNGGYYAGGSFTQVAGQSRPYLVHLLPDFSVDPAFTPGPNSTVETLLLMGPFLFVGGSFTQIGGQAQGYVARLDLSQNGTAAGWSPVLNGVVYALHPHSNPAYVYIGGNFTLINEQRQQYVATLDMSTGSNIQMPSANSTVLSIADYPSIAGGPGLAYLGGNFSATGFYAPFGALLPGGDIRPDLGWPTFNGGIEVILPDGNGGWYVGGNFSQVGGISRPYLARITSSLTVDPTFAPNPNTTVRALVRSGDTLYVGGDFTQISSHSIQRIAALDASTGQIISAWQNNSLATGANNSVRSLVLGGGVLYAGGAFTQFNGQSRSYVASVNPANGGVLGFNPTLNSTVEALAYTGSTLYLGGSFSQVNGQSMGYLAALDGAGQLIAGFTPQANSTVQALDIYDGNLWVGGSFTQIGGQPRNRLARVSLTTGAATTWNPNANSTVSCIREGLVAGSFTQMGGQPQSYVAAFAANGNLVAWNPGVNSTVNAVWSDGTDILIGGQFTYTDYQTRPYLTAYNPNVNRIAPDWNPQANGPVRVMVRQGGLLFAGGSFTQIGGQPRNRLAALDAGLSASAGLWNPNLNSTVEAITVRNDTVYVGGQFTQVGTTERSYVAAIHYAPVANPTLLAWNPQANSSVRAIFLDGRRVLVGGNYLYLKYQARSYLLAFNYRTQTATGWNPAPNNTVEVLASDGTYLYVGGRHTQIAGQPRAALGRFALNGNSAPTYDLSWDAGFSQSGNRIVYDIELLPQALLVVGQFEENIQSEERYHAAAFDPANGDLMAWDPRLNLAARCIGTQGSDILLGGNFQFFDVHYQQNLLAVNEAEGEIIRSWNASANSTVQALALMDNWLYLGGVFTQVSGQPRSNLARVNRTNGNTDTWNPNLNGQVHALLALEGTLYVGGAFSQAKTDARARLAAFQSSSDNALSWNPGADNTVFALAGRQNEIFVGGSFNQIAGQARSNLAKLDGSGQLVGAFTQNTNSVVYALDLTASRLYVGGGFTQIGGWNLRYAAAVDLATDQIGDWNPDPNSTVWTISARDTLVLIGGSFTQAGGATASYGASVDAAKGEFLANLDVNTTIRTIADGGEWFYAGGSFTSAGGDERQRYAIAFDASSLGSSDPVSIDRPGAEQAWHIYPNPAREYLIVTPPAGGQGSVTATLLGPDGRRLWGQKLAQGQDRLSLPALPAGIYLLRLETGTHAHTQRLMIR